jgi:hypothetical protein
MLMNSSEPSADSFSQVLIGEEDFVTPSLVLRSLYRFRRGTAIIRAPRYASLPHTPGTSTSLH